MIRYIIFADCTDGDVLLYDGHTLSSEHSNGTVLVCLDNVYGSVCDDFWDPLDAAVVCTQLEFPAAGQFSSIHTHKILQLTQLMISVFPSL